MKDHTEDFNMNKNETDALVIHEILAIQSLAQRMREPPRLERCPPPLLYIRRGGKSQDI